MTACDDLVSFADGEIDPPRAEAFRAHLTTCEACRAGLVEAMQLGAQLSTLVPRTVPADQAAQRAPVAPVPAERAAAEQVSPDQASPDQASPGQAAPDQGAADQAAPEQASAERSPPVGLWHRVRFEVGGAVVSAVAVAAFAWWYAAPTPSAFAGLATRPYAVRLAYAGAADHRPVRDAALGAGAAALRDRISLDAIAGLEKRGDLHGAAIAELWNGARPGEVAGKLAELAPTLAVRSDRAAMAVLTVGPENAEPALAELEALERSPDPAIARAARWNHALLLSRLELPLTAAQAFRAIAAEHEPGWAAEASDLADPEARGAAEFRARWRRAYRAGEGLVAGGAPPAADVIEAVPGIARAYLYQAVRVAQTRDRVLALAPMAAQLDRLGDPGQHALGDYVQRVAGFDFARRAPLARAYAALLARTDIADSLAHQLLSETGSDEVADIAMGAMLEADAVGGHRAWLQRTADRSGDRWLQIVVIRAEADAARRDHDAIGEEQHLVRAQQLCTPAVDYQCVTIARRLATLYTDLHRVPEALRAARGALPTARSAGEWGRYGSLLLAIADAERFHQAPATVRAYAREALLSAERCTEQRLAHHRLAGAAILDFDARAARGHLIDAQGLPCDQKDLPLATYLSDIALLDPRPTSDLAELQSVLAAVRADPKLGAAERAIADVTEGQVLLDRDRAAGAALLDRVIEAADALPGDVVAHKARAAAYAALVLDAARAGDAGAALGLMARDLGLAPPAACSVAIAASGARSAVVVRGADGTDRAVYDRGRRPGAGALVVPAELAERLARCAHVSVMASPELQGEPRVLPAELAWGYAASGRARTAPARRDAPQHTLIVTNVTPPGHLGLAPLSSRIPDSVSATVLSGSTATPARVLAAMSHATEIEFHTHALLDVGVSDASHLVLSPEGPGGRYALTAEAIRSIVLQDSPIVILGACHSARGAHYEHAPWSLPDALLAAGARAVLAVASEIPDVASGEFFARVLARVRAGADPAAALRDERLAMLRTDRTSWAGDAVLLE